jgi:hypothetical protein
MIKKFLAGISLLCTLFLFVAFGQNTGTLTGKITSADGRAVPSASISVTDSSGQSRSAISAQDGSFTMGNLPPGTYRVDVEGPGFKKLTQENVQVSAGSPVNLQLGMQAGNTNESVQVQGQAPLGDDRDAQMGHGYSGNVMSELPVYDLNHMQLVEMMTGITPPVVGPGTGFANGPSQPGTNAATTNQVSNSNYSSILINPQMSRSWNTNGQPEQANQTRIDGLLSYDPVLGTEMHVSTISSIQQMNVANSNYRAETGWAGGSAVNTLTRSGTNAFHGDLFAYNATNWTRARDYFNPKGTKQADLTSNQFGGDFGAPIVKNKTFVFLGYEGDYLRDQTPTFTTVPTAAYRAGDFSAAPGLTLANPFTGISGVGRTTFTNNVVPSSLINPMASRLANALPAPNFSGLEYNYFANVPVVNDGNRADIRLDQHFSDRASAFLRYGLSYYNTDLYSPFSSLGADGGASRLRADEAAAGWTQSFGPTTYMELRAGYNRYSDPIGSLTSPLSAGAYGFTGTNLPEFSVDGMLPFGTNPNYPQLNKEQTFEAANDWHARFFNQDLRFGVDALWTRMDGFQNLLFGPNGGYNFSAGSTSLAGAAIGPYGEFANAFAGFLMGAPTTAGITTANYVPSYLQQQYGGYIADRVNVGSRLTLDLGVRYDFFRQLQPRNNASAYSVFNPGTAMLTSLTASGENRYGNVLANTLNFAPRFGAAYRFNDRTVIRAGYGWAYWNPSMLFAASTLIPQMNYAQSGVAGSYATAGTLGTFPSTAGGAYAPDRSYFFSPNRVRTPYVQMYNIDIQRDLTHGVMFDIAYVGNTGRELPYTQDLNAALPGTGAAGMAFARYGLTSPVYQRGSGFNSNYNSLQVNATKRFSQGISFAAAYTYSKSLDYGAGLMPFLNNSNPASNYGPSDFDRTHVFTLTHNLRLPFGAGTRFLNHGVVGKLLGPWELDGIFHYATGMPFTPTASAAACACPGNTPTALVSPGPTYVGYSYYPSFFGFFAYPYLLPTNIYSQPAAGTLGNVGRNSLRGPNFTDYDLALSRSFVFVEQTRLEFRAEAYNIANSTHFASPVTNVNSSAFGQSLATIPGAGPRTLQFALKLVF